jgi:hypothetical protein
MNALMPFPAVALLAVECHARQAINLRDGEGLRVVGPGDAKDPVAILDFWILFTGLWFGLNRVDLQSPEISKRCGIAACISENPSLQVSIDSSINAYWVRSGGKGARA